MKKLRLSIAKRPTSWAFLTTSVSLVAGACAIVMADFGQSPWLFAPLVLWLLTIGLPTTMGVLAVALCWGRAPGLYGLVSFAVCASAVGFLAQAAFFFGIRRTKGHPSL